MSYIKILKCFSFLIFIYNTIIVVLHKHKYFIVTQHLIKNKNYYSFFNEIDKNQQLLFLLFLRIT
jgi:hypothetical protein